MDADEIVKRLKALGQESYQRILRNHGAVEPVFGVKIEELKKIQKIIKKDHQLALALYDTGIYDAMYLAGLIADDKAMSKDALRHWAANAKSATISFYTVPWVTAQGMHGRELALEWIESDQPDVAVSGWATLGGVVTLTDDEQLDLRELTALMGRVRATIADQPSRVRTAMCAFLMALGGYVQALTQQVLAMCAGEAQLAAVPTALEKMQKRGVIGKKRKTIKC